MHMIWLVNTVIMDVIKMKLKLALLSLILIGSPAFAQEEIKLPDGFQKGDFYVEHLSSMTEKTQEMYILKGNKVKLIKFKVPVYEYKVSDSDDIPLIEVGYKLPRVTDIRSFKEQHPKISKLFKVGSFILSPLGYILSLAD